MIHITLPSGASADLRPVSEVTERQRRPIKRIQAQLAARPAFAAAVKEAQAIAKAAGTVLDPEAELRIAAGMGDAFDLLEDLNDSLVAALVAGWSYGFAVTVDGVQDVPGADLDALRKECAPYLPQLLPDFEPSADADSPIAPSGA
jgi:hypothetical protein